MNRLRRTKQTQVLAAFVEGNSIRACADYYDERVRNVQSSKIQRDEIWSFCYAKAHHAPESKQGQYGYGDVWTWTALDPDSKLMVSWLVGPRSVEACHLFIDDLASRVANRIQLTTDASRLTNLPLKRPLALMWTMRTR